jgi:predicted nucleic acid-binding protein
VLDASVLYPLPLRDTLLRVAETELYDPLWSERILAEVARTLIADGRATEEQADRLLTAMRGAFDAAAVPEDAIARLEPAMTNDPGDRHVLAAAIASPAQAIVTLNLRHFPDDACEPFAVEPLHPDEFLLNLHALDPEAVTDAVRRQASVLQRPPLTFEQLLELLAAAVPNFAETLR